MQNPGIGGAAITADTHDRTTWNSPSPLWLKLSGLILTIVLGAAVCALQAAGVNVPNAAAPLVVLVAYAAITGGVWIGLAVAALALGFDALHMHLSGLFVNHGQDTLERLAIHAVTLPVMALLVGLQRRRLEAATARPLMERQQLFAAVMGAMHDAIVVTDLSGINDVNDSFCRMTGFTRAELLGVKPPFPFWPAEEYAAIAAALEQSMRRQQGDLELTLARKNGERFPALLSISRIAGQTPGEGAARTVYSFKDISDLKRTNQLLNAQRETLELIATGHPLAEILEKIAHAVEQQFPGTRCGILLLNAERTHLSVAAAPSLSPAYHEFASNIPVRADMLSSPAAALSGRRVITPDVREDPAWIPWLERAAPDNIRSCCASPMLDHAGKPLGTITIYSAEVGPPGAAHLNLLDTACHLAAIAVERRREEEALRHTAAALQVAGEAKDRFLGMLSHELRAPLTPLLATAASLENDPALPSAMRDDLDLIRRSAEMEARLIDGLLDLTQVTLDKVELSLSIVDGHKILSQVVESLRPDAGARALEIEMILAARNTRVRADGARLRQVFWNVLRNAVQYTPHGGKIVIRTSNRMGMLAVEMVDNGIGIEPDFMPRLFQPFQQSPVAAQRRSGGLGLGLAIAKALVDAHGGSINAASDGISAGTTFTITLPVLAEETQPPAPPSSARFRILLVEDHADTQRVIAALLRRRGHAVATAATIAEALQQATVAPFDLLVTDIGLPDGSGVDLMQKIQRVQPLRGIALSGYGRSEDIRRSREAGFYTHLVKPVQFPELDASIYAAMAP